ncbi:hypothetical protein BX661DRAFT_169351 [Kickxella alabastrina]|uniref:uncharacterized protein n=1 Tax=Kickxella alabastrina TaxID=61397 RepID=UPI00221E67C7|nr:uncharacterized protein BX661DRAFT_169351 [Kickxella alabastrina]KAI7833522.1 hypothetical protein BX661DRAFT_169351 [Kickxella alabastrina]
MSDYSAWNQLFRLNPDTPQTPMLSNQELQDELALWSNAQFQLEPMAEEQLQHNKPSTSPSVCSPEEFKMASLPNTSAPHQHLSWDFMMGTSTAELLNAIALAPPPSVHQQSWPALGQQSQQQHQQTPVVINGVPMVPLVPLAQQYQQSQQQAKPSLVAAPSAVAPIVSKVPTLAPAPSSFTSSSSTSSSSQFRHPTIMPKGGVALPLDTYAAITNTSGAAAAVAATPQKQQPAPQRRAFVKTKREASLSVAPETSGNADDAQSDDEQDNDDSSQQQFDSEGRVVAASEDKRRRNTAASARFRIKKKLKEQALERTAREMANKAEALEKRVNELETETRWLKSLITEKDPNVLKSLHCPCHHPNGLDVSATPLPASAPQTSFSYHHHHQHQHQHLNIAPNPAGPLDQSQQEFKKPRV